MRRFSQRSGLVTLSEFNITPLLDLAFVLLIIFIITTPVLEASLPLRLPHGGTADKPISAHDIRTVEITPKGDYSLDRTRMNLDQIEANLKKDFSLNPNLVVRIRADESGKNKDLYAIIERCRRNGITRMYLRTDPSKR